MDVPFLATHPSAPTREWDMFEVNLGSANVSKRLEENGNPRRTASRVLVRGHADNTDDVKIGPKQNKTPVTVGAGGTYLIEQPGGGLFTIGEWWGVSATADQKLEVYYV